MEELTVANYFVNTCKVLHVRRHPERCQGLPLTYVPAPRSKVNLQVKVNLRVKDNLHFDFLKSQPGKWTAAASCVCPLK